MTNDIASALDALAEQYADTTVQHNVLNSLAYAFRNGLVDDVERALEPLADQWLDSSLPRTASIRAVAEASDYAAVMASERDGGE